MIPLNDKNQMMTRATMASVDAAAPTGPAPFLALRKLHKRGLPQT